MTGAVSEARRRAVATYDMAAVSEQVERLFGAAGAASNR